MKKIYFIIFGAIIASFSFYANVFAENTEITIKEVTGLVQAQKMNEEDWTKVQDNETVTSGDKIRSFLESSALLVFPDGSEFRLRENTSLDIKDISRNPFDKSAKRELKLNLGSLHYKVPPKKEKTTEFKVHSSTSIVGITGTEGIITAKGEGKPSENILIEGATFNTNDQGQEGYYQRSGNVYKNDGKSAQLFNADVEEEAGNRLEIDEEYVNLIRDAVMKFKTKRDEGYRVGVAETLIKQAFFYLEKREYDLVKQTVGQINTILEKAKKIKISEELDQKMAEVLNALNSKEAEGYDVIKPYILLAKVQGLKQSGQFSDIKQILTQAEKELALLADENRLDVLEGAFLSHYRDAQKRVLEKGQQGFATGENKALLRQAEMFYEQGEKPRAYLYLKEAEDKLSLALKNVTDAFKAKMVRLEGEIAAKKAAAYPTKELELRLEKVKVYLKDEDFLRARELVSAIEEGLSTLTKNISAEWQLKISDLKRDVNYKRSTGYNLGEIPGLIGEIENYQVSGDLVNLKLVYEKVTKELDVLKIPDGFDANWKNFLKQKKAKSNQGYDLKEVDDLSAQIETAIAVGDVKSARSFLNQAKKTLNELKDREPPKVQVISFSESKELIQIEGYASDNLKVKNVLVNNFIIKPDKEGKFTFKTVPNPSVNKLSVLAKDFEGNISAPVVLNVTVEGKASDPQADLKEVTMDYTDAALVVKGKFVPGGKVKVGSDEVVCDNKGQFKTIIKADRNKAKESISVAGIIAEGATTKETVLNIEDKWAPKLKINKVSFNNNFVPALNVEPLTYDENKLSISGQVVLTQMANIEGSIFDLGGEIESLKIENTDVDIREDGIFNASLTIDRSRKDPNVKIVAKDKSGNTAEEQVALDAIWAWPSLKINDSKTFQKSLGKFSKEVLLTADTTDIAIVLEDSKGETIASKRLPVAAVLPPELEIQDVRYENEKVVIAGRMTADGIVSDKNKALFLEDIEVTKDTIFTLKADYPPADKEVVFVGANIEGKLSEEVKIVVGPPKDKKAPVLYISSPQENKKKIIITGFVDDDSEVKEMTIQGIPVTISAQKSFHHEIESTGDLNSIEITATDIFGNKTAKTIALKDKEPPTIVIDQWEAKGGRLLISGSVEDNIGVKEIRLNDMPIVQGNNTKLVFTYNGTLTEDSQNAVIVAVDLLNNKTKEGPRKITIPEDDTAPKGKSIGLKYGSPIVYASGEVVDPAGVKAVYVNGEEVELFDDGTFNVKVNIDVGSPKIELESPSYDNGKVIIVGKVSVGDFSPAKVTVESEDLSGNRGVLFTQDVMPYQLSELEVVIDGEVIELEDEGNFRHEKPIDLGQKAVEIKVQDPFENSLMTSQKLEDKKPVLTLDSLQYKAEDETVILSGKAQDEDSGIYSVSVNGIRTDVNNDGSFTYKTTFNQAVLNVLAADYIGNETSLTKEVKPPDIWPPVFSISVSPVPAIIGEPVYVEIAALDSKTRFPEILKSAPAVSANADGIPVTLTVAGEGANYIATLETVNLEASLITLKVQGEDEAGNESSEIEGTDAFAVVEDDTIAPSFTIETDPSPVQLGISSTVKVLASEDLKVIPSMVATMPSGAVNTLNLSESGSGVYQASMTVPVEEGIGNIIFKLSGGEDLSGNIHDVTETTIDVVAPTTVAELPLNINLIDFVTEKFILNGQTASEAIVHIEAGKYIQDIVADAQGMFRFERPISITELENMYTRGPTVSVKLKAHNYAGFESRQQFFEVTLPPLPERGGTNFEIRLNPSPAGQGELVNISVEPRGTLTTTPKGFVYLPNGQRVSVNLQGRTVFDGQYQIPEDVTLGTAMFEVVSGDVRESVPFEIVLSNEWMQRLNKYDFFKIRVSKDPLIIGDQAEFFIETLGNLPQPPRLEIRLPDGRTDNIPLSGTNRFFQGTYFGAEDLMPGRAELILNPGTPEEVRRPYGIEDRFSEEGFIDTFLFANPNPLIGGEPYNVNLSFSQDVSFKPRLVLKLQNGRVIEMPLDGSAPSNKFTAQGTLSSDIEPGLAKFVLFDDQGMVVDRFPAQISSPFTTSIGKDIFVVPDVLHRMEMATIQLNSITSVYGRIEARVSYPDGTKTVVPLEGTERLRKGTFMVPDYVPLGMVTISVFDDAGLIGTINAQIAEYGGRGGPVNIFLSNPNFEPYESVKLNVETSWPMTRIPKAELFWDGGSKTITLTGQIPGNRFVGDFLAPRDPIEHGRIEIRDAQGAIIDDFPLDHGPEGKGEIIVTPMPPIIGQPLSIKVVAPSIVDSAPIFRLIFEDGGQKELNAYGPIPGDTFTASLAILERPLSAIEIVHEGQVVERIPVEYLSMTNFDFFVEVLDPVVVPCEIVDVIVRANDYVPFTPYMSVDFNGRIIDVPLSKISPTEFLGRMSVPCDVSLTNYDMRIFDPQGKLLWQRNFVSNEETGGLLNAYVMPIDATSVELSWDMISGIDGYEIRYGETPALGQTAFAGNVSSYTIPNLTTGQVYFFQVAARKSHQDIMVSDIIDVVVGGTTREVMVNFNIMNDNDVNLYWNDYAGADMYRVLWGTAIGAYPNTVDVAATNYVIPDLDLGGHYYVKIKALKDGQVIGESPDIYVHIEDFMSSGGEINFNPDPPVMGQDLIIDMHFYEDLPFIPEVVVRLQDRDVSLIPTGQYRDYNTDLTGAAFNSPIKVIDVLDPEGRIIASRAPGSGSYSGAMVPVILNPDPPQIGQGFNVRAEFSSPPPFIPRLFVEYASGIREYTFPQAASMSVYEYWVPAADVTSSVLEVRIEDLGGAILDERILEEQNGGYEDVPFTVEPNPPVVGLPVNINLETDMMVSRAPKLRIYYASGMQEVNMTGTVPGRYFTYYINQLESMISKIDIVDPTTGLVKHTWNPEEIAPMTCTVVLQYDPPQVGQLLQIRADFPNPVSFVPQVNVYLENATKNYTFPGNPGLSSYEIFIPAADITSNVTQIEIVDDLGNAILCERFFDTSPVSVQSMSVNPDPPVLNESLILHVEFNTALGFRPKWRLHTLNEVYEDFFSQGSGYSVYDQTIPASSLTSPVTQIEIYDDLGEFLPNGEMSFNVEEEFTCMATFNPDPPVPYAGLTVTADYPADSVPTYKPWMFIEFDGGSQWNQEFSQAAGMQNYSMTIPAASITDYVIKAGIGEYPGDVIDCGRDFSIGGVNVTLTVNPDPPVPNNDLYVTANFSNNIPFIPELDVELSSGTIKHYVFPGSAGLMNYNITIPGADITSEVDRIVVKHPDGHEIMSDIVFALQSFDITSISTIGSDQINVCWTYDEYIDEYKIYYGTASGNYNGEDSPVVVGNSSCYTLGSYEVLDQNTTYYVKVEAYDVGNFVFSSTEESITLSTTTVEYPTGLWKELTGVVGEIKVYWDSVSGVDGYRVYYGRNSQTYTESGSPLEIDDPSATQAVINGLLENVLYYITVEAYIGTVESNNPNEVSSYPGSGAGGALTANPTSLNVAGNAGASISQESVIIENSGTTAVNVASDPHNLIFGANTISSSQYSIAPNSTSIGASGGSESFTVDLNIPSAISDGLYAGTIRFFTDLDNDFIYDDGEAFVDVSVQLTVSSYDHLVMSSDASSSTMGNPIFVTLKAEDDSGDLVTSYDTDVSISVSESSGGNISNSWILSTNGAPGGSSTSAVGMYGGWGNFTVDAQEPETLTITAAGAAGHGSPLALEFRPTPGSSATKFAIIGPNRAAVGPAGATVWIATVDANGKVVTDSESTLNIDATGNGADTPVLSSISHTFSATDNGQYQVTVTDASAETVTIDATGSLTSASIDIDFIGVSEYLVDGLSGNQTFNTGSGETTIDFVIQAADSGSPIRFYNKTATFSSNESSYLSGGSSITFEDGRAEITLNSGGASVDLFTIAEDGNPTISTGSITVNFQQKDTAGPEVIRAEMDTPWIVHLYFDEDIDSGTGGYEDNYSVPDATVNKVCWYGDNVTLHLSAVPSSPFVVTINNVQDQASPDKNTISSNYTTDSIVVPDIDYTGGPADGGQDWYEVQVSDTSVARGESVHVTIYHKNVCGYLTGSNAVNKNQEPGTISVSYSGSLGIGGLSGSPATSVDISSGQAEFDVTAGNSGGTVTISASGGGVSTQVSATMTIF